MHNKSDKLIALIVGTRPNFIKVAPILKELRKITTFKPVLIHTGQHFDFEMSRLFFRDLEIRKPDYNLGINGSSHAELTARMMICLEKKFISLKPDIVTVVGDVDSTLAASLTAAKLCIPVAHVEAGLRSFDPEMPEEFNRIVTDRLSDFLFIHSEDAHTNLIREGITKSKIYFTGNIMIDMLKHMLERMKDDFYLKKFGVKRKKYVLLTLHRPTNVDNKGTLSSILKTISLISEILPVIFPVHPRTLLQIRKFRLGNILRNSGIITTAPLGYIENLGLLKDAAFVMTDSGGIQEESTYLHIPCLTMRENTERPITVEMGTNTIVGTNGHKIMTEIDKILTSRYKKGRVPKFWDGRTSERIVKILKENL